MHSSSLDPALLSTFLAVLDAGRISAAAKVLHLSQPAVTAQIQRLEASLGGALFVRTSQGVTPTDAGARLAGYARSVQRLLDEAMSEVMGASDKASGPLVVATSTTIAAHLLPSLLARFRSAHPRVPIRVDVGNTEHVVDEVRAGRVPLGLVEGHARASGVHLEPFVEDQIVPLVGRDAPFAIRRAEDLDRVPILWREAGSGTRAVVERALRKAGLGRRSARDLDLELGSTEAILGGVVSGLGVGFVSESSARVHLAAGLVRVAPELDLVFRRTFYWALPAKALAGAAARFYAVAKHHARR